MQFVWIPVQTSPFAKFYSLETGWVGKNERADKNRKNIEACCSSVISSVLVLVPLPPRMHRIIARACDIAMRWRAHRATHAAVPPRQRQGLATRQQRLRSCASAPPPRPVERPCQKATTRAVPIRSSEELTAHKKKESFSAP